MGILQSRCEFLRPLEVSRSRWEILVRREWVKRRVGRFLLTTSFWKFSRRPVHPIPSNQKFPETEEIPSGPDHFLRLIRFTSRSHGGPLAAIVEYIASDEKFSPRATRWPSTVLAVPVRVVPRRSRAVAVRSRGVVEVPKTSFVPCDGKIRCSRAAH